MINIPTFQYSAILQQFVQSVHYVNDNYIKIIMVHECLNFTSRFKERKCNKKQLSLAKLRKYEKSDSKMVVNEKQFYIKG